MMWMNFLDISILSKDKFKYTERFKKHYEKDQIIILADVGHHDILNIRGTCKEHLLKFGNRHINIRE